MKSILFIITLAYCINLNSQTLADFYKKERIGVGIGGSYLTIPGKYYTKNNLGTIRPFINIDIRYQKPTKNGFFFQYRNTLMYDLLPEIIWYQSIDDGNAGNANIASAFFGRFSLGKNFHFDIEKGTAFSGGIVIGDTYLALANGFNYEADGFYLTPGIFINYDRIINEAVKLKISGEVLRSINNLFLEEGFREKEPIIASVIIELMMIKGFYATAESATAFNIKSKLPPLFDPVRNPPYPIRLNLGIGYRFNF